MDEMVDEMALGSFCGTIQCEALDVMQHTELQLQILAWPITYHLAAVWLRGYLFPSRRCTIKTLIEVSDRIKEAP